MKTLLDALTGDEVTETLLVGIEDRKLYHALGGQSMLSVNPGRLTDVDQQPKDTNVLQDNLLGFIGSLSFDASSAPSKGNKTVIAMGQSGSGKSTMIKFCLDHALSKVLQKSATGSGSGGMELETSRLHERLDRVIRLVEVFGNAQTSNNADSSRMGKLIKIFRGKEGFDFTLRILMIEDTRLRVLRPVPEHGQGPNERSFHIFHYLAKRHHDVFPKFPELLDQADKNLGSDGEWLDEAFEELGMEPAKVWDALAAIWLLATAKSFTSGRIVLASTYLRMSGEFDLAEDLTKRSQEQRLTEEAELFIWAKNCYRKLLLRLFPFPSTEVVPIGSSLNFLDVCGFESLPRNRLQQLLINDCNDKLREEYGKLAINRLPGGQIATVGASLNPSPPSNPKNKLMDTLRPCTSAERLSETLKRSFRGPGKSEVLYRDTSSLEVNHTNGKVQYEWTSFVTDNLDGIRQDRLQASAIFAADEIRKVVSERNVIKAYDRDWTSMKATLAGGNVFFMHCVKAHPDLLAWKPDANFIRQQIDSLGVVATLNFLRDLPGRCVDPVEEFERKFGSLVPDRSKKSILALSINGKRAESMAREHNGLIYYSSNLEAGLHGMIAAREAENAEREKAARLSAEKEKAVKLAKELAITQAKEKADQKKKEQEQERERQTRLESVAKANRIDVSIPPSPNESLAAQTPQEIQFPDRFTSLPPRVRLPRNVLPAETLPAAISGHSSVLTSRISYILVEWQTERDDRLQYQWELRLQQVIKHEVERTMYSQGPEKGTSVAEEAHRFLERALVNYRREAESANWRRGCRPVRLVLMLDAALRNLQHHWVVLSLVRHDLQLLRATPMSIEISDVIRGEFEADPQVWSRLAKAIGYILKENVL